MTKCKTERYQPKLAKINKFDNGSYSIEKREKVNQAT